MPLNERMSAAFDDAVPQPSRRDTYPIVAAKVGQVLTAIILSDRPTGTWTHYWQGASYPCCRDERRCPFRHDKFPPRWKGYLAVLLYPQGKKALMELPAGAMNSSRELRDNAVNLRGRLVKLSRTGERTNSPTLARIEDAPPSAQRMTLPEPWNVREAMLTHYWRDPIEIIDQLPRNPLFTMPADFDQGDGEEIPC